MELSGRSSPTQTRPPLNLSEPTEDQNIPECVCVRCCRENLLEPLRSCREPLRLCLDPRRSCRDPRKELCERLNGEKTRNISICADQDQDQQPPLSHLFHISGALCLHILDRACLPAMRQYLSLHQC